MIKKNLNKEKISKILSEQKGFSLTFSKKIINDLLLILQKNLKERDLNLKNIGSFKLLIKNERTGRNPKTGINYKINARKSISFRPSKNLKKIIIHKNG